VRNRGWKVQKSQAGRQFRDEQAYLIVSKTLKAHGRGYQVIGDFGRQRHEWIAQGKPG